MKAQSLRKPAWLQKEITCGGAYSLVRSILDSSGLHTVCEEAHCPNRRECYSAGTATFLILGDRCTRSCRFCAITSKNASPPDPDEPLRVADAVQLLGLKHAVITSVTRDDLPDGGALHFADTIQAIRHTSPDTDIEVLIPDFKGSSESLALVTKTSPSVLAHNIETVPRLYDIARPQADYKRSLAVIDKSRALNQSIRLKSGIMLGIGETVDEVKTVLHDLHNSGCEILTIGQYLQPDRACLPVERYITPDEFAELRVYALNIGYSYVSAGPFVRSSYRAEQALAPVSNERC